MKNRLLILFALAVSFLSCGENKNKTIISGKISGYKNKPDKIYLMDVSEKTPKVLDTASIDADGSFSLKTFIKNKSVYTLRIGKVAGLLLVLDSMPVDIHIEADSSKLLFSDYKIEGSKASAMFQHFFKDLFDKEIFFSDLNHQLIAARTTGGTDTMELKKKLDDLIVDYHEYIISYLDTISDPAVGIFVAHEVLKPNPSLKEDMDAIIKLKDRIKNMNHSFTMATDFITNVEEMQKYLLEKEKNGLAIGSVAPEISLSDPSGNKISLSSLRGKVVLVDFWASWCMPCRAENPNVVAAYNQYKNMGFTIYSVSLDTDKSKWTEAIQKDQLTWPYHVSDLAKWSSAPLKAYGIESIPMNFLLDKNGKILAKGLRGEDVADAVKKALQ